MRALIAGGAGFVGSRVAKAFQDAGWEVFVLDGLLPRTGASLENLPELPADHVILSRVEETESLASILSGVDLVVDSMAWTSHRLALRDPEYDLALNLSSHLRLLAAIPENWRGRIIFLGSRSQYGSPQVPEITEDTPQHPEDVQGIHKTAAESHFRLAARLKRIPVASLRMPAIIGPNQPVTGDDIGLFGGFIRDLVAGRTVELYGENRRRAVIHVDDVAETVVRLASAEWSGFAPFNLAGHSVNLAETLRMLIAEIGAGSLTITPAPEEIAAIDIGGLPVSEEKLAALIGTLPRRDLRTTLCSAIENFRK